ncbi:glycosyltransferase [Sutcliffiella horikoshii]
MGAGGAARTLLNIINNLDRERFSPVLVTLNYEGSYETELKSDVKVIKLNTKRLSRSIFSLSKLIRTEEIDIVFSTIPRVNTIAIIANLLSFSKAKNVIREADNLGGSFTENLRLLAFGAIYKLSSQIISLSEGVKVNLINRYKVKADRIKVIYNPIDLAVIKNKLTEAEICPMHRYIFTKGDCKTIMTAGRLVPQKDHKTLLKAFSIVVKDLNCRLVILGEGPLKNELIEYAKELGVHGNVHFVGFQKNPYTYMRESDLFVLSSIHEGFSHVIAEALATGLPVVSTNCLSGPEEVLDKGKYGVLCEVADEESLAREMLRVLTLAPKSYKKMVDQGYTRAKEFNAEIIVKKYEEVFCDVISYHKRDNH